MDYVYILFHIHYIDNDEEEEEDLKILGVYSTKKKAEKKIDMYKRLPGFCDHIDGFEISKYEIDIDHWPEGFVTVR